LQPISDETGRGVVLDPLPAVVRLKAPTTTLAATILVLAASRYGREVCAVFVGLRDVGLDQVRAGMAWWYREYAKEQSAQEREDYAREEEGAKAAGAGLWKDAKPVPPWEWRRS
jgi:endonuclease YncB( thermonuclease family)